MNKIFITLILCLTGQSVLAESLRCNRNTSSFDCLVCNCYHESRGEPREGRIAVAKTVLSRKESDEFPDTVCGVVYQPAQFSWTGGKDTVPNDIRATKVADITSLQECRDDVNTAIDEGPSGYLYFYNPRKARPVWASASRTNTCARFGEHVFLVPKDKPCPKTINNSGTPLKQKHKSSGGGSAR